MPLYVEIVRRFRDLGDRPVEPHLRRAIARWGETRAVTWDALLAVGKIDHIVLVAPAMTGKSTEMTHQASRLRLRGRHAVYADAKAVARSGFEAALRGDDAAAWRQWHSSDERIVLFIDGVDELGAAGQDFASLTRHLRAALDVSVPNYQIVISARTGGWYAKLRRDLHASIVDPGARVRELRFDPLDDDSIRALAKAARCERLAD